MTTNKKLTYETPQVELIEVQVEQGFANSGEIEVSIGQSLSISLTTTPTVAQRKILLTTGNNNIALNNDVNVLIAVPAAVHNFSVSLVTSKGIYYKTSASKTISTSQILKMGDWYLDMNSDNKSYVENGVCLGQGITLLDKNGNKIIWAPVNCGYDENHKYGLLYQWGRKDGQGYYDESKEPIIADGTLDNPDANTFYKGWTATAWSDGNNPCPEGWRVPTINELNSLYDNSKIGLSYQSYDMPGLWFYGNTSETQGNNMFFPAAGQLTNNGTSSERGENCYYWSSDTDGEKSEVLVFYKNRGGTESVDAYVQPLERAYGCSVRCVME